MRKILSNEEFVVAWQESSSLAEAAKRCHMSPRATSVRAAYMRLQGVPLKRFARSGEPLDVAALTALAQKSLVS